MKILVIFGAIAAAILYFFSGIAGTTSGMSGSGTHFEFDSDKSTEALYNRYDRFVKIDNGDAMQASFMFFGTPNRKMTVEEPGKDKETVSKMLKVDGENATRIVVRLTPLDGGKRTHVEGEVENYPIRNDDRLQTMKSSAAIAELLKREGGAPLDMGSATAALTAATGIARDKQTLEMRSKEFKMMMQERQDKAAQDLINAQREAQINAGLTPQGSAGYNPNRY
jgi:hypothetical protein